MVRIIDQSYKIITDLNGLVILKNIELAARTCYKSEHLITEDGESAKKLVKKLVGLRHTAMLEFGGNIHVRIICNRGLTHELVRHRLCSFAQESTRYCDYTNVKHSRELTVIRPIGFRCLDNENWDEKERKINIQFEIWKYAMEKAESCYFRLRGQGVSPQVARGVLPIDTKTEINISANPTEWRHIFRLRTSKAAHPQIREIMLNLLRDFRAEILYIFDELI